MRMKIVGFISTFLVGAALAANAVICTNDEVPAATLLLPYFEVDLSDGKGLTTQFSINNASAKGTLAKVEVWSDLGVAIFGFNVYLTGYDVEVIDLRDVLLHGDLPQTIPPANSYPSCAGALPPAPLSPAVLDHVQRALTGNSSPVLNNKCAGINYGDKIARGYVTVDVVSVCTLQYQGDPGYWGAGGTGVPTNDNVLWGDSFFIDPTEGYALSQALVHIEADAKRTETSVPGYYTFYGRFVNWTAIDNREPLPTTFGVSYDNPYRVSDRTDLLVWRDPKINQGPFTCPAALGLRPSWYPLGHEKIVIFDQEENAVLPDPKLRPFPAAAQRTAVGGGILPAPSLPVPFTSGWLFLNLNTSVAAAGPNPPVDPAAAQAWVSAIRDPDGTFHTGYSAVKYDSACAPNHSNPRTYLVPGL